MRYEIKDGVCDECHSIYIDGGEFDEIERLHPEWRANVRRMKNPATGKVYSQCEQCHTETKQDKHCVKKEFLKEWSAAYNGCPEVKCFSFEADCHGDRITLCAKHLREPLEKLESKGDKR